MVNWRYDPIRVRNITAMGALRFIRHLFVLLLIVASVFPVAPCLAQGVLRSEITPESGHIDDLFIFTVTFEGPQERINPQFQAGGDFEIQLLGPKSSISIINGQVHSRQQFVYQLTPKREGQLKTPEVQAMVDGELLSAPPITVMIKSASAPQAQAPDGNAEQIFMRQTASPVSAYLGEQVVNAITVYTRVNLRGVRIEDDAADGFWQETISDGQNSQKTVNGIEYGSAQILRALFALKTGELRLPTRKAIVQVPVMKRGNPFGNLDPFSDDFFENFFQRTVIQEKKLTSNELSITIKPLPPIPTDLSQFARGLPIVGDTSVTASYSEAPLKVGESKNISILVASTGHLNPLKAPTLIAPPGVKIYDGQTSVKHDTSRGRLLTQKSFNYSVVPTQPGVMRIPGVSIAYFDPESSAYKLATTSDISLVVSGDPLASQGSATPRVTTSSTQKPSAADTRSNPPEQIPAQDLPGANMPYAEKTLWEIVSERVSIQLALLVLSAAILVVGILFLLVRSSVSRAPKRQFLQQISQATNLDELETGVRAWAGRTLPTLRPGATFDEIRALIRSTSSNKSTVLTLLAVLDDLEVARYASQSSHSFDGLKRALIEAIRSWR
jgi:hypothetical protein